MRVVGNVVGTQGRESSAIYNTIACLIHVFLVGLPSVPRYDIYISYGMHM